VTVAEVVAGGDRGASLRAVRDALAVAIDIASPRELALLSKQLRETLAELDGLDVAKEVSASDDLAAKRKARRAGAKTPRAPRRSDEQLA